MTKVLIIGSSSFVASGLGSILIGAGFEVDYFTRGSVERKEGNKISGNILELASNVNFNDKYDIVINFVILKDNGTKENIEYITSLIDFCKQKNVKQFIYFSSIMVYANNEPFINEKTDIESLTYKKGYGEVKIEVDKYLLEQRNLPFKVSLVRPGYVLAEGRPCPFVKKLPLSISIIKGNRKSVQPIVKREDIHKALLNMIQLNSAELVYLFTPSTQTTKYEFAKQHFGGIILSLPKWLILGTSRLFLKLKVISPSLFVRVEGMYIESKYDSTYTEKVLNIKF
jgi:nucleoside-diphosphate-sugar epimerase